MNNQRNLLLAVVMCGLLIFGWDAAMQYFYPQPDRPVAEARADTEVSATPTATASAPAGALDTGDSAPAQEVDLDRAVASADRVRIDGPRVSGTVNPIGARLDDLSLKDHGATVEDDSGPVRILAPQGTEAQQYAEFGFLVDGKRATASDTVWQVEGGPLGQNSPVTLRHATENGQELSIRLTVDANYMITAEQTVSNPGASAAVVQPFATVNRTSEGASLSTWIAHAGPIATFDDAVDYGLDYDDLEEAGTYSGEGRTDWIGFTDTYWLTALVPQDDAAARSEFRSLGNQLFRADVIYDPVTLAPGASETRTTRFYAGAKESVVLDQYQDAGVSQFGLAISWGWFRWFEKPLLWLLRQLNGLVGNFGVAIILLTVIVRGLMFPIAQKQFASMAAMKAIQPKMKAVQERYKDDRQKQQQEIMALYKKEGVNPLAGCLPLLLQIPIFYALYKVLLLAIEMRHEPFLYIPDLADSDPANFANLLGLVGIDVPGWLMLIFGVGVLAVLLGVTMWMTFRLNPTAMDPMQQQIFNIMPWVLMFVMANFAAGLLLYWVTSNILTLAQQTYLYSKHPQLKAAAEKQKEDEARAKARDGKG